MIYVPIKDWGSNQGFLSAWPLWDYLTPLSLIYTLFTNSFEASGMNLHRRCSVNDRDEGGDDRDDNFSIANSTHLLAQAVSDCV